jgi:protease YdgD
MRASRLDFSARFSRFSPSLTFRLEMHRTIRISTVALFSCLVVLNISDAQGADRRPGIVGNDDRVRVIDNNPAWDAIGQVNVAGYRRTQQCTGTLIAPDRVVTAAHCLRKDRERSTLPPDDIHFVAGVRGPQHEGHSTAKCVLFPLQPSGPVSEQTPPHPSRDIAVVVLKSPLSVRPAGITEGNADRRQRLIHAAYAADRRYALSAHFGCRIGAGSSDGSLWFTDCDTHPASSGGPLLVEEGDGFSVAAIMLGASRRHGVTLALPISRLRTLILALDCP